MEKGSKIQELRKQRDKCLLQRNWEGALEAIGEMIDLRPSSSLYTRRAMVSMKLKRHGQALGDLRRALALDENYSKAKELLTKFYPEEEANEEVFDELEDTDILAAIYDEDLNMYPKTRRLPLFKREISNEIEEPPDPLND